MEVPQGQGLAVSRPARRHMHVRDQHGARGGAKFGAGQIGDQDVFFCCARVGRMQMEVGASICSPAQEPDT